MIVFSNSLFFFLIVHANDEVLYLVSPEVHLYFQYTDGLYPHILFVVEYSLWFLREELLVISWCLFFRYLLQHRMLDILVNSALVLQKQWKEHAWAFESEPSLNPGLITTHRQFGLSYSALIFSFIMWDFECPS